MLNVVNTCALWWRKIRDLIRKTNLYSLFRREHQIVMIQVVPLSIGQPNVLPKDSLSTLVIETNSMCEGFKASGRCRLRKVVATMNHKGCVCADLAFFGTEVCDSCNRLYRPSVVEREGEREGLKIVVETDSITNKSASRLKQDMYICDWCRHDRCHANKESLNGSLVNVANESGIDLGRLSNLRSGWAVHLDCILRETG